MVKVYLLRAGDLFKIGITKGLVENRIKQLSTGNAEDIDLVNTYESERGRKIESILHRQFKHNNVRGEWFNLEVNDILNFTKLCKNIDKNLELIETHNTWYQTKLK